MGRVEERPCGECGEARPFLVLEERGQAIELTDDSHQPSGGGVQRGQLRDWLGSHPRITLEAPASERSAR